METDLRGHIIDRLEDIKKTEKEFDYSFGWKNVNFAYKNRNKQKTSHVSLVDFYSLENDDLVRFFEYILLMRSDITTNRVDKLIESDVNFFNSR